ncbi:GNAT family N-acetyltransferase [Actinomadura barringtoniae]|uniref:Arsenite methyltransferase n=1 Tax=Actinomadura barringtoniae TaxID=1427535 RepID=A0A939PBD4_9ACTN|nr:GNAT family N-acetyltransferase [Actinomadura barringtoniae]MBO2449465.1 GNAT family N-acetyltransferase [Actinomadura barringtoniae]
MSTHDRQPPSRDQIVDRYGALARAASEGLQIIDCEPGSFADGCFGAAGYGDTTGLPDGAVRASLGCGDPTAVADLRPGDTVLDLGSGGGIDVLITARRVAPGGIAYGLDASADMLELARANAAEAEVANARFLHGHIEEIPLDDATIDVVISNCVINLSTDKPRVLAEAFRVLRPGGRLGVSDVIADSEDGALRAAAEERIGCTAGALTPDVYREILTHAGFIDIAITPIGRAGDRFRSAIVQAAKPAGATEPEGVTVRRMRATDADQVLAIYQAGLDTGDAGFETSAPAWQDFDDARLPEHRYVAADTTTGDILGWIAAVPVSGRCVYRGVVEHSVYVHPEIRNRGVGIALLRSFIASTEAAGIWTVQSSIFPENTASLRLHQRAGFRVVGTRERLGLHHDRWRDVILIERRTATNPLF